MNTIGYENANFHKSFIEFKNFNIFGINITTTNENSQKFIIFLFNFQSLLKPRKSQTTSPEGSTTTISAGCSSLGISSPTVTESTQDIRCSSNEDELDDKSTSFSHALNLKG